MNRNIFIFFTVWFCLTVIAVVLNILNINWVKTSTGEAVVIVILLGIIQGSVLELVVITLATIATSGIKQEPVKTAPPRGLTVALNYNLLATAEDDIDETYERMYGAFIDNLTPHVVAVLVSATSCPELKQYEMYVRDKYRRKIFSILYQEGEALSRRDFSSVNVFRRHNFWAHYTQNKHGIEESMLWQICFEVSSNFMCIHRVSRVLRKCGQYQDLMLLSAGDLTAFSYTDKALYSTKAREYNEPLFHPSDDVMNIHNKSFDYTLVLDGDTSVPPGTVLALLSIAAANPNVAIIQPSIKLKAEADDTIFMHLECIRQNLCEPMTRAISLLFRQGSFYGKGLIKNSLYIKHVIGTREQPIERVPVDVLSHDTFEAAVLKPLYASSVSLIESPCLNYVTWNIRERRWNKGEIILAMYFWPKVIGRAMRALQKFFQGEQFVMTYLRIESKLDFVSFHHAHCALRQMCVKPLLLLYTVLDIYTETYYPLFATEVCLFLVIVFPKFALIRYNNIHLIVLEAISSMLQFTPEAVVGCVRVFQAFTANITTSCTWVPQRCVEERFRKKSPFLTCIVYLWKYSLFAAISMLAVSYLLSPTNLLMFMLTTVLLLPVFAGITAYTALPKKPWFCKRNTARSKRYCDLGRIYNCKSKDGP